MNSKTVQEMRYFFFNIFISILLNRRNLVKRFNSTLAFAKNMIYFIYCNYLYQTNRIRFHSRKGEQKQYKKRRNENTFVVVNIIFFIACFHSFVIFSFTNLMPKMLHQNNFCFHSASICFIFPLFAHQIDHLHRVERVANEKHSHFDALVSTFKFNPLLFQSLRPSIWIVSAFVYVFQFFFFFLLLTYTSE